METGAASGQSPSDLWVHVPCQLVSPGGSFSELPACQEPPPLPSCFPHRLGTATPDLQQLLSPLTRACGGAGGWVGATETQRMPPAPTVVRTVFKSHRRPIAEGSSCCYADRETQSPTEVFASHIPGERLQMVGMGRRGNRKVKKDEGWIGLYLGAFAHILPPQFLHPLIFRESDSVQLTFTGPCPRGVGSKEALDVVNLLATLLPGRKGCQATEHPDGQNWTPGVWARGSEVKGEGPAKDKLSPATLFPWRQP